MPTGGSKLNLLPEEPIESLWDALWLGIQPFLCFTIESRKVVQGHLTVVCGLSGGGWQVPRICTCVEMGDMWGRAALSSGRVTCDTCGPFLVSGPVWE